MEKKKKMTSFGKMSSLGKNRMKKRVDYHIPFYKNHYFHVFNRGNGKEKLFYNSENYRYFLQQYKYYMSGLVSTYAFCLLPNHFHLLIKSETEEIEQISQQFRKFFISYSMSINKQEERNGSLLQRGVKRRIIEDDKHLINVVAYIHENPVHHGISKNFSEYNYSSYKIILSEAETEIKREEVIGWFGNRQSFIEYHENLKKIIMEKYFVIEE